MLRTTFACLISVATLGAASADEAYIDDRSSPGAVVRSLYSAINRGEYGRAWSYFHDAPAASIEKYAAGYENTERVEIVTGSPSEEGAMGSSYYELPVAIEATNRDGSVDVFAGCYSLRRGNLQTEAEFQPLGIVKGALRRSDKIVTEALPRKCGDGPEMPVYAAALEKAKHIYETLERCHDGSLEDADADDREPSAHRLEFNYSYDDADTPPRTVTLFKFLCSRAAYNESYVFFMENDLGEVAPLHFASPELDIRYEDEENKTVESITVTGFNADMEMVNATFDEATMTLQENSLWRGMGDASSSGTWEFRGGQFRLTSYSVDASYDGEINPETVVEYGTP
jgi:hypothetical protein